MEADDEVAEDELAPAGRMDREGSPPAPVVEVNGCDDAVVVGVKGGKWTAFSTSLILMGA